MKIVKIFNNNALIAKDSSKNEIILMGCGIGFRKNIGELVDTNLIEKTFILKQKDISEKFKSLLEDLPTEHVSLSYDIIEYAKNMLDVELNDYIYITLTDHISYSIKIAQEGIKRPNALMWEIEKFYNKEYKIGLKALEFIKNEIGIELSKDEAANIALHLINSQINKKSDEMDNVVHITKMVADILSIVTYVYSINLDEKSLNYERFITHLRFFFQRIYQNQQNHSDDDFLLIQVKEKYEKAYRCMCKIESYLGQKLTSEEKLYLTLHIQRVTAR